MVRSRRLTSHLLSEAAKIGDFFLVFKNNMGYLGSETVMGIQQSSSHPLILSLQLNVMFACPSKVNPVVPLKIDLNKITRIIPSIPLSFLCWQTKHQQTKAFTSVIPNPTN